MLLIPATSSMSLCSSFISTSSEKILAFRSFQLFLRRFFLLPFHVFVIEPLLMNPWCLAFVCRPMHCNVETFCVVILCHCFFFVVSFLFRSPALVQQVQICWCPQWLEEANLSACKIHLCRERLFHHRILDNQNIARLVNSRVTLQRITRLCIAPIEPPIHLNLSAIITLDASKHLRPWVRAGLNQRRHKEWGKPLTVITNPPETGPPMKEG